LLGERCNRVSRYAKERCRMNAISKKTRQKRFGQEKEVNTENMVDEW